MCSYNILNFKTNKEIASYNCTFILLKLQINRDTMMRIMNLWYAGLHLTILEYSRCIN